MVLAKIPEQCELIRDSNMANLIKGWRNNDDMCEDHRNLEAVAERIIEKTYRVWELERLYNLVAQFTCELPTLTKRVIRNHFFKGMGRAETGELLGLKAIKVDKIASDAVTEVAGLLIRSKVDPEQFAAFRSRHRFVDEAYKSIC